MAAIVAASTDDRYARMKANSTVRVTLPRREEMDGATNPKTMSGTRKKIISPLICFRKRMNLNQLVVWVFSV